MDKCRVAWRNSLVLPEVGTDSGENSDSSNGNKTAARQLEILESMGKTVVLCAVDGEFALVLGISDVSPLIDDRMQFTSVHPHMHARTHVLKSAFRWLRQRHQQP